MIQGTGVMAAVVAILASCTFAVEAPVSLRHLFVAGLRDCPVGHGLRPPVLAPRTLRQRLVSGFRSWPALHGCKDEASAVDDADRQWFVAGFLSWPGLQDE